MRKKLLKHMRQAWRIALLAALLLPVVAQAAKPAPPPAPTFTALTKVGESYVNGLYAGGQHAVARYGNEVVAAFTEDLGTYPKVTIVRFARSRDGGVTWLPAAPIVVAQMDANGIGSQLQLEGSPLAIGPDPAGGGRYRVHVGFAKTVSDGTTSTTGFYYTYWTVDPATQSIGSFSTPVLVSGGARLNGYWSVAADPLGGVHIAFDGDIDGVSGVRYSRSADYGATFVETATLVSQDGRGPVLAADAAGDVYCAYDRNGGGAWVAKRLAYDPVFGPPVLATATGGAELSLACSSDGSRVYLAWTWDSRPEVGQSAYHVASSSNGGGMWTTFDSASMAGPNMAPSVAVSPNGKVGVAFTDWNSLYYVSSLDGQSWSTPAVIPAASPNPSAPSIPWLATLLYDSAGKANIGFVYDQSTGLVGLADAVYFTKEN